MIRYEKFSKDNLEEVVSLCDPLFSHWRKYDYLPSEHFEEALKFDFGFSGIDKYNDDHRAMFVVYSDDEFMGFEDKKENFLMI